MHVILQTNHRMTGNVKRQLEREGEEKRIDKCPLRSARMHNSQIRFRRVIEIAGKKNEGECHTYSIRRRRKENEGGTLAG